MPILLRQRVARGALQENTVAVFFSMAVSEHSDSRSPILPAIALRVNAGAIPAML